jgi:hypothetical protein
VVDKRRLYTGKELEDHLWIGGGCILERNWKISCGEEKVEHWKGTGRSVVDKRRLVPGKELEDHLLIRESWSLEMNSKISCG